MWSSPVLIFLGNSGGRPHRVLKLHGFCPAERRSRLTPGWVAALQFLHGVFYGAYLVSSLLFVILIVLLPPLELLCASVWGSFCT